MKNRSYKDSKIGGTILGFLIYIGLLTMLFIWNEYQNVLDGSTHLVK